MSCFWYSVVLAALLLIQYSKGSTIWPFGKYSLLKPKTGCPTGWEDGFFLQDTVAKNPNNSRSQMLHIDGGVTRSSVTRSFCFKTKRQIPGNQIWPEGQYCIYRRRDQETIGMETSDGSIHIFGEKNKYKKTYKGTRDVVRINKKGFIRIYFACKTSGDRKIPIELPITKPFYLLPYGSRDCQQVKWMVATTEWIKYHTRRNGRARPSNKSVPYYERGSKTNKGITMFYCYYQSCKYTLNETKGVFQSLGFPDKYPDGQLCSWRIMVPANHTITVTFTYLSLYGNDILKYSKSINDTFSSWYTLPNIQGPVSMTAESSLLFVFHSDKSKSSSGFRADYVFIPRATTTPFKNSTTLAPKRKPSSTAQQRPNTYSTTSTPSLPSTTISTVSTTPLYERKPSSTAQQRPNTYTTTSTPSLPSTTISTVSTTPLYERKPSSTAQQRPNTYSTTSTPSLHSTTTSTVSTTPLYERKPSSTAQPNIFAMPTEIPRPAAEQLKDSFFHSQSNTILAIVIPAVCFPIGFMLLLVIIYQCRISRKIESRARISKRNAGTAGRSVINPTYESGAILLCPISDATPPNTAALNGGDGAFMHQTMSRDTQDYEDIEYENPKNSVSKELDYIYDSGPNPLYHVLEGPDLIANNKLTEDQTYEDVE